MGISDMLNASKIKEENERLKRMLTPEMQNALNLQNYITELQNQSNTLNQNIASGNQELSRINQQIQSIKSCLVIMEDDLLFQDFALYTPKYDLCNADEYKERLSAIRNDQKQMIKIGNAVSGNTGWTLNGSVTEGAKMVKDMQKLLLRAFNSECDEVIGKVKYNNIESAEKRIKVSCDAISKLGKLMNIVITRAYYDLKIQELYLAYEYQQKKQEEKEALKQARAEMREQAKLEKELEEQRKKIEKEQTHYQTAYEKVQAQLIQNPNDPDLLNKKAELEERLTDISTALTDIDYRQANMKAGYVYVISNIGAFGKDIYKIGMTRRLDPQDRIDELGSASVPFNFDVHAMIFSDDAPALEAALHRAFEDKKLNMVNQRREFFHVSLDEIKRVVKENFDKTVEFIDIPDAEQYRISLRMHSGAIPADEHQTHVPDPMPVPEYAGEILHTKWGSYQMPDHYKVSIHKGPRNELTNI